MKGLKVKKYNLMLVALLFSTNIFAGTQHCFSKNINFFCQNQDGDYYSLEGHFDKEGIKYEFSSRRAFDGNWCQDTLRDIQRITISNNYCIEFEEYSGTELTINKVLSSNSSWSYFN